MEQSTLENNCIDDPASRKKWAIGSCNTVLGVLRNADIISTSSMENAERTDCISGTVPLRHRMVLPCLLHIYHGSCLGSTLFYSVLVTYITCNYYSINSKLCINNNPKPNPDSNPTPIVRSTCC